MSKSAFVATAMAVLLVNSLANAQVPPANYTRAVITGKITEKKDGHPIAYAEVAVMHNDKVVTGTVADELGNYEIKNIPIGRYTIVAYVVGFRRTLVDTSLVSGDNRFDFALAASDITFNEVTVTANEQSRTENKAAGQLRTLTSAPVFQTSTFHGAPTSMPATIIQQSVPGAVQASTGSVHIQGQHAEYSYMVDGLPVPETQSEGMRELFDPRVVDRISFLVGHLPAEYSDALSIIDVKTKIPATPFSADASGYYGSFNSSGQNLSFLGHSGNFSYFFAGSRKTTDRRIDTPIPNIFHDHGTDLFGLGKVQYILSSNDIIALDVDQSNSRSQVPYDSTGGIALNDNQQETDGFQNLIYRHGFEGNGGTGEFFFGLTHRNGTFQYIPGATDVPSFYFSGNTTPYNIREDRSFNVYGARTNINLPLGDVLSANAGLSYYLTNGTEHFSSYNSTGTGPQSLEPLRGYDLGAHIQADYQPLPVFQINAGVRYDRQYAEGIGTVSQVSPKVKLTYLPDFSSSVYLYYGRLFVPVFIEQMRQITGAAGGVSQITQPLRGNYFEVGLSHVFSTSWSAKIEGYYTQENPGLDNNTIPGTAISTAVNIQHIFVRGVELGLNYHPVGPFSGFFNLAVSHAQGDGRTTGGFLPATPPTTAFDLDHDQRLTYSIGLNYDRSGYYLNLTSYYGSGLTNGQANGHVAPHIIFNGSIGKTFYIGRYTLSPEFFVNNILNDQYLLKGAFFSGAIWGEPRSLTLKVAVGIL